MLTRTHHLLVVMVALLGGCRCGWAEDRPNFLWIVAEDISPLFGCYGDKDAVTPNIDAFAKKSHVFRRAFATASICAPSRSCLATGMYATSLGTQNLRSEVRIPPQVQPVAKQLRDAGYWTALRGKTDFNFDPAGLFDHWKQDTTPWRTCPEDKPFFAFMNLGRTHEGSGNLTDRAAPALARLRPEAKHDRAKVVLPPYYPDTPEMRRIWARYHDLITVFDQDVGEVLASLAADGRDDDTIVFLMADHGLGLPRYKRWLYLTGLQVPLIVHVPERFQHLIGNAGPSSVRNELVSYVDLPATVLAIAGQPRSELAQGIPLFAANQRDYVFGARDRADDMYDLSRCVFDGRYLYVRHFLPHQVPMQEGIIMSDYRKESHQELHRIHRLGRDTKHSRKLWEPRPHEQLFDTKHDPRELSNLAADPRLTAVKSRLASRLRDWILETRDSGFMPEPEMHRRANELGMTPFEMLQDDKQYPIAKILHAAELASSPSAPDIEPGEHAVVSYWAIQQRIIRGDRDEAAVAFFTSQLTDRNPIVRTTAAEALARAGHEKLAAPVFKQLLRETEPNLLLYVARSLAVSFDDVTPLESEVRAAHKRMLSPPESPRRWKDFNYSAFTTWALEWSLIKSGKNTPEDFGLRDEL